MSGLKFGDRVIVTNVMSRREEGNGKTWEPRPDYIKPKRREGIFLGYRTLQNGIVHYGYNGDDPTTWEQTGTVRVALVCLNAWQNPVYVPLDAALTAAEAAS